MGGPEGNRERYQRYKKKMGKGAFKTVYEAFDTEQGNLVAWNHVERGNLDGVKYEEFRREVLTLKDLDHKAIIKLQDWWESDDQSHVVFITELMTSGDLKKFIKTRKVNIRTTRKWARQILEALDYLHTAFEHPIVHRDIKCDNIFINGNLGEVKLGDLGLSTMMTQTHAASVLGTPEFMAPEMYGESYNQKVDIYAFGMCILEIFTGQYPYQECQNAGQIFMKVNNGVKPRALVEMENVAVKHFIESCLGPVDTRPTARELLDHPLLIDLNEPIPGLLPKEPVPATAPAADVPGPVTSDNAPQANVAQPAAAEGAVGGVGGAAAVGTSTESLRRGSDPNVGEGVPVLDAASVASGRSPACQEPAQIVMISILSTDIKPEVGQQGAQVVINAQIDGSCPRPLC